MKPKLLIRVFTALVLMLLLAGLMPEEASAAAPTTVYVNGEDILSAPNNTVNCGGGRAVYDQTSNTLTLVDAEITNAYNSSSIYADGDLEIVLEGQNTINQSWACIQVDNGSVSISGNGSLNVTNALAYGIWADNDISISADVTNLYVSAATQALRSEGGGSVTIGGEPFTGIDRKITIENGEITCPLYELTVDGTDILTAPNNTVQCDSGEAVYDPQTNTLTLYNVQIDYQEYENDNTKGAILFDGDLNIKLVGDNFITSACGGIYSRDRGTLTITGDKLTIDSVYTGINKLSGGNITIDGAKLDIAVDKKGNFQGRGIVADSVLSIENGAYVNATEIANIPLVGSGGIVISDSTVYAYVASDDTSSAIISSGSVSISNSFVDARTSSTQGAVTITAGNDLTSTPGDIMILDNSNVTIYAAVGNAVYTPMGNIVVSDSAVTATNTTGNLALVSNYDITISGSNVEAKSEGSWAIYAMRDLVIEGDSDVTASGGTALGAANSFTLIPPDKTLIDVWMGDSEDAVSRYSDLPLSEETVITETSRYFHSEVHKHTFDQEIVSDAYKASDANCTEPAAYYKSCICGGTGTETFTNGTAIGHNFEDGRCTVCGEIDSEFRPVITAGANGEWQKDSRDGLSFTSNAAFADFRKVQVDGRDIDVVNYEVREGSTIVTLKASYLETLSVGRHTLSIVSDTGTATTEFTIKAASAISDDTQLLKTSNDAQPPQTGDSNHIAFWFVLIFVTGTVLIGTVVYRRKKKYSE